MSVDVKYRTTATARGGRDGTARTEDGTFEVKLATPRELGGAGGEGNNPEQLFAAFATWDGHIPVGSTVTEPIHMVDWYPTLLKLCGASREQALPVDGLDVWSTLTQGKPSPHDAILLNTTAQSGAVRVGGWKLVVTQSGEDPDDPVSAPAGKRSVELFNLLDDPYEKTNLAEREPRKRQELHQVLTAFARQAVPPKAKPKPPGFVAPKVWGEKD